MKNATVELVDHEKAFSEINYNDIKDKPWSELTVEEMLVVQINDTTPLMTTAYRGEEMLARCMNVSSTLAFNVIGMLRGIRDEHDNDPTGEAVFRNHAPEWAHKLFMDRFGIKLIN